MNLYVAWIVAGKVLVPAPYRNRDYHIYSFQVKCMNILMEADKDAKDLQRKMDYANSYPRS